MTSDASVTAGEGLSDTDRPRDSGIFPEFKIFSLSVVEVVVVVVVVDVVVVVVVVVVVAVVLRRVAVDFLRINGNLFLGF